MKIDTERSRPRSCTARRISTFNRADVAQRLFAQQDVHDDFRIVDQLAYPSGDSRFDVCTDGETLFVSVLIFESMMGSGEAADAEGLGPNGIEILLCPYGDEIGFLQYGAGPGCQSWFNHHWPYRDGRKHLGARPVWEVEFVSENMGEEAPAIAYFRFPLTAVVGEGHTGALGFNVMRTQNRFDESSTWSYAGGAGFSDASSCGWLRLSEEQPVPVTSSEYSDEALPGVQLQATYDFPDEMVGGPYTPEVLRGELRKLREHGFGRVYWIDYPQWVGHTHKLLTDSEAQKTVPPIWLRIAENFGKTVAAFGGDPMPVCAQMAHEEGLEFFTVMKPYDTLASALGTTFTEYSCARNPAWLPQVNQLPADTLTLYSDNDAPLPFAAADIKLYGSDDNVTYTLCQSVRISDSIATRPRYDWTPAGKRQITGEENVRRISFEGIESNWNYFAIEFPSASTGGNFGNQNYLLVEAEDMLFALSHRVNGEDFRRGGFDFYHTGTSAGWADCSEGIEMRYELAAGKTLGIRIGCDAKHAEMPDPSFAQVRESWLRDWVQRAIDAGADGVDVRVAFHTECNDWLAHAFASPVLEAFRRQTGREPQACPEDYATVRRIRGSFHTQFLRDAKRLLQASSKKLEAHVEARMKTPPQHDTYAQIHWDYATWIDEGILDGVNLKYLGPFNPFVEREILPRARRRGIPVHVVAAVGHAQTQSRTPEWFEEMLAMVQSAGMNGLNLYEMWTFMRTTPDGVPFLRGCTRAVLARLHQQLQEIN